MALFATDRERRLWLWGLAVLVAIYASLVLGRTLAGVLRDRDLLDATFALGFALAVAATMVLGWRSRPGAAEIGVTLGIIAVYLMAFVRMAIPEERTHLVEYGVLAVLIHEALTERASHGRPVPAPALLAVLTASAVGVLDELVQGVMPTRVFDPLDMMVNVLAAVVAVVARLALGRVRRRRSANHP